MSIKGKKPTASARFALSMTKVNADAAIGFIEATKKTSLDDCIVLVRGRRRAMKNANLWLKGEMMKDIRENHRTLKEVETYEDKEVKGEYKKVLNWKKRWNIR